MSSKRARRNRVRNKRKIQPLVCRHCGKEAPKEIQAMAAKDSESVHGWDCGCKGGPRELRTWTTITRKK